MQQSCLISRIQHTIQNSKGMIKKKLIDMLSDDGFPKNGWSKDQVTDVLVLLCHEAPYMIPVIVDNGWVEQADKQKCILAMGRSKSVVRLLDFRDHKSILLLMRTYPATIKHISAESIPEDQLEAMLDHMGLTMHPCFWTLSTEIIKRKVVSNEVACEFMRRAVHHADVGKFVAFLAEANEYDFSDPGMLHYIAPIICPYLVNFPGKIYKMEFIRTSSIMIEEILARFRWNFPEWTGCARKQALYILRALSFRFLHTVSAPLRFFAKEFPVVCVEKTKLFQRDDEIIRLILTCDENISSQAVANLDFAYIADKLFQSLVEVDGVWGALMHVVDRYMTFSEVGCNLRLRLLKFLLQDRYFHHIFMHPSGEITATTPDGHNLVIMREFNMVLARYWPDAPVNIHPIDLWSSFPHGRCDITDCLEHILATNGNHIPPRHEFYFNRIRSSWEHASVVRNTMRKLASIDFSGMGVTVAPLLDADGNPVCVQAPTYEHVMLLWPRGCPDFNRVNLAILNKMGVSFLDVLMGPKMHSTVSWLAFRAQPLFDWICPSFEQCNLPNHPREIIQVSHHVQTPDIHAVQSTRFSPWLVVDPLETNPVGPRLMSQTPWLQHPTLVNIFNDHTISSGNQLLVAYQHFGNMRTLLSSVLRPELDMEQHWVMAITHVKHTENRKAFNRINKTIPVITTISVAQPLLHGKKPSVKGLPLILDNKAHRSTAAASNRGKTVMFILQNLPHEIVFSVYKFLLRIIMASNPIPSIRHAIPDFWWLSPKQLLFFSGERFFVKTPITSVTDSQGVLLPHYHLEVYNFVYNLSDGFQFLSGIPFAEWNDDNLAKFPTSSALLLQGKLFVVHFKFNGVGYYLTIEPDYGVYKIHDLNLRDVEFGVCLK